MVLLEKYFKVVLMALIFFGIVLYGVLNRYEFLQTSRPDLVSVCDRLTGNVELKMDKR